jgi:ribosomal protein L21E
VNLGDRVRIERDEIRYPSKGTWPQFRGRTGTVVEVNADEYGVVFAKRCALNEHYA